MVTTGPTRRSTKPSSIPRRSGRGLRTQRDIEHTAYAQRSFDEVCGILEVDVRRVLARATTASSSREAGLVRHAGEDLPGFDSSETVSVRVGRFDKQGGHAWLTFTWDADKGKRLLTDVRARLDVRPLVGKGPSATTELILRGRYEPGSTVQCSPEAILFGRRVVKAALHALLDSLVEQLDEFEESILP